MGHNIAYVYMDIDNSFDRIKKETKYNGLPDYIEVYLDANNSSILIFTKDGKFIIASTSIKPLYPYNFNNSDLRVYETFLKSKTNSKIYKLDTVLIDIWIENQPSNWEEDNQKIEEFFIWLKRQDINYWKDVK